MDKREEKRSARPAGRAQYGAAVFRGTGLHPDTPLGAKQRPLMGASGAQMPNGDPPGVMLWGEDEKDR